MTGALIQTNSRTRVQHSELVKDVTKHWWLVHHMALDTWWRHQIETLSALLAICAGNSPVPGEFPAQRPVMRSFDVFSDLRLNKRLRKQSWGWWFEPLSCLLWRHCNGLFCWAVILTLSKFDRALEMSHIADIHLHLRLLPRELWKRVANIKIKHDSAIVTLPVNSSIIYRRKLYLDSVTDISAYCSERDKNIHIWIDGTNVAG